MMIRNHFTATGIVFNDNREILMILHNKLNVWLPPGGHIDENELPSDAALREIFEETGVRARILPNKRGIIQDEHCRELDLPFTLLLEDIEGDGTHNHIDMVYICVAMDTQLTPQKSEVDGIGWFSFAQIKQLKTYDNVIQVISQAVEYVSDSS